MRRKAFLLLVFVALTAGGVAAVWYFLDQEPEDAYYGGISHVFVQLKEISPEEEKQFLQYLKENGLRPYKEECGWMDTPHLKYKEREYRCESLYEDDYYNYHPATYHRNASILFITDHGQEFEWVELLAQDSRVDHVKAVPLLHGDPL